MPALLSLYRRFPPVRCLLRQAAWVGQPLGVTVLVTRLEADEGWDLDAPLAADEEDEREGESTSG